MVSIFCLVHVAVGYPDIYFLSLDFRTGSMHFNPLTASSRNKLFDAHPHLHDFSPKTRHFFYFKYASLFQLNEII